MPTLISQEASVSQADNNSISDAIETYFASMYESECVINEFQEQVSDTKQV